MNKLNLGEDNEVIYLHDLDSFYTTIASMSEQAHRHIRLFSHDLDPELFNSEEIADHMSRLATSNPHVYLQFLIQNTSGLRQHSHRLLDLAQRISSYIEIRVTDIMHAHISENFYLFDDDGYVKRHHADEYIGEANFFDARTVRDLEHRFKGMWERAEPDPHLRRMSI